MYYITEPIFKKTKRYSYAVDNIYNTRCYNCNYYKIKFISCHKIYKDDYVNNDLKHNEIYNNEFHIQDRNELIKIECQEKKSDEIDENNLNNIDNN